MKTYRVGIVGMGFGQKVHAPGFYAHERFELAAVAGARPHSADALAQATGARAYDDWRDLVRDADVDVISIATAPHMHAPVALAAIERGHHILLEKPTALDAREAGAIAEAARNAGVLGAIVHEFRFRPERLAVYEAIRRGDVGRVLAVHVTSHMPSLAGMAKAPVNWLFRGETGGGFLGAIGSHAIDAVQWWVGEEIVRAWGDLRSVAAVRPSSMGGEERATAEDSFIIVLHFASGAVGTLVSSLAGAGFGERWEVLGDRGAIRVEGSRALIAEAGQAEPRELLLGEALPQSPAVPGGTADARTPPFLRLLDRYARALDGDEAARSEIAGLDQGLRVQRALDAVRLASATGGSVRVLP